MGYDISYAAAPQSLIRGNSNAHQNFLTLWKEDQTHCSMRVDRRTLCRIRMDRRLAGSVEFARLYCYCLTYQQCYDAASVMMLCDAAVFFLELEARLSSLTLQILLQQCMHAHMTCSVRARYCVLLVYIEGPALTRVCRGQHFWQEETDQGRKPCA